MDERKEREFEGYWIGLRVLERLSERGTRLTSAEVAELLGARNVKGIGQVLSRTRFSLLLQGIRFDEAVQRRTVGGRVEWSAGPRIRQARHALEHTRREWAGIRPEDDVPVSDVAPTYQGPVLVLRALMSSGTVYRVDGGMAELDAILDDGWFERDDEALWSIGEVFIHRIEGPDSTRQPIPEGYGENGIWIRGAYDYADPRVASGIGTGHNPAILAWIGEAKWAERRIALVDAMRQVEKVRAGRMFLDKGGQDGWRDVVTEMRFPYVRWIGTLRDRRGPHRAPPLRMRLRCWYEIVILDATGKRTVLREEGWRGDAARTTDRALERWRNIRAAHENELVLVNEIRIAKRQPRPMAPE